MILADDLARMDWNSNMNYQRKEGRAEIIDLNKWLVSQGRSDDILRYTEDPKYLDTLLEEFHSSENKPSQE